MPAAIRPRVAYAAAVIRGGAHPDLARDLLGHDYKKFLPFLLMIFTWTLVNNWFGELFVFMLPTFSKIGYAYALGVLAWLVYVGAGFGLYLNRRTQMEAWDVEIALRRLRDSDPA